jgi:membrane-bound lytic murein transglycosylase D
MNTFYLMNSLTFYFEIAALFSFSAVALYLLTHLSHLIRFKDLLKLSKALAFASLFLPMVLLSAPKESLMRPRAQIFSNGDWNKPDSQAVLSFQKSVSPTVGTSNSDWVIEGSHLLILFCVLLVGCAGSLILFSRRYLQLKSVLQRSHTVKKIGNVSVLASAEVGSPFSYSNFLIQTIVIPTDFLSRRQDFRIAIQHEFQHHRSGDTHWVYFVELLKILFFWNPFIYLFIFQFNLIQEFACDEFLIGHQKTSPQAYGGCLVRTAESAVQSQLVLVGTASMAGNLGSSILKRRIEMLFKTQHQTSKLAVAVISGVSLTLMASFAYASKSAIQERKITMEEARVYAEKTAKETQIPIDLNDLVLKKLNYFVGTAHGRAWVKGGLARMKTYQKMIDTKTSQLGLPQELIAIPLFESAFQNDVVSPAPYKAAGIWQFVAGTAQRYNLTVDEKVDERLDPEKETEAAMKYFSNLKDDFHDWRLAIKAYNEGEHQVQQLIDQLGTKDPWVIEKKESKEAYLSGAIAMMIVLKNPELQN